MPSWPGGLDPAVGVVHADHKGRDSLAYDIMEPYRPIVDRKLLDLLDKTTFSYGDFVQTSEGQCRLHPQLAKHVVATCGVPWADIDVRTVADMLI